MDLNRGLYWRRRRSFPLGHPPRVFGVVVSTAIQTALHKFFNTQSGTPNESITMKGVMTDSDDSLLWYLINGLVGLGRSCQLTRLNESNLGRCPANAPQESRQSCSIQNAEIKLLPSAPLPSSPATNQIILGKYETKRKLAEMKETWRTIATGVPLPPPPLSFPPSQAGYQVKSKRPHAQTWQSSRIAAQDYSTTGSDGERNIIIKNPKWKRNGRERQNFHFSSSPSADAWEPRIRQESAKNPPTHPPIIGFRHWNDIQRHSTATYHDTREY